MACDFQPDEMGLCNSIAFSPTSKPNDGFRWRPPHEFGPPSRRIMDLFSRYDFGWGARGRSEHYPALVDVLNAGRLGLRMIRLPAAAVEAAAAARLIRGPRESLEHKRMKRAALLWMRSDGATDARNEADCPIGRADAYSEASAWAVECGNTDIRKLQDAMLVRGSFRLTLIPYQELDALDGRPRRLIAVDMLWTADTTEALWAGIEARDERRHALRRLYGDVFAPAVALSTPTPMVPQVAQQQQGKAGVDHLPHMCRDGHAEIRHALSDDDERCPVCRERDRADFAERQVAALKDHAVQMEAELKAAASYMDNAADQLDAGHRHAAAEVTRIQANGVRRALNTRIAELESSPPPAMVRQPVQQQQGRAGRADGWQDIETAPKDRTRVIVAVPSLHVGEPMIVGEAYFDPDSYDGTWWWAGTNGGDYYASPIHETNAFPALWQPLPAPPEAPTPSASLTKGGV